MRLILAIMMILILTGCESLPFKETELLPMPTDDISSVLESFTQSIPEHSDLLSIVSFETSGQKLTGIGYLSVDEKTRSFSVVCLNPMGVKLFEFAVDSAGTVTDMFAIPPLDRGNRLASTVGADIKRIYLDLIPREGYWSRWDGNALIMTSHENEGIMEYVFAGKDGALIKKLYRIDDDLQWRVSYFEYVRKNGKLYPNGIVVNNYRYGYRLIIKVKEIND